MDAQNPTDAEIRAYSESACQTEGYLAPPEGLVATREQVEKAIRAALTRAQEKGNRHTIDGDQPEEFPFPATLTPPLRRVLSMMMWETGPIAHALRATGQDIARKAEDEQAVVLHWLVGFVLEHGDDWHKHAAVALRAMTDSMTKPEEQQP